MRSRRAAAVALLLAAQLLGASPAAGNPPAPQGYAIGVVTVTANLPKQPSRTALDKVDWDSGWGAKERAAGLPNPKGWYRALMGPTSGAKVIYLTFDDGPTAGVTPQLLDLLGRHKAKATFFVLGGSAAGEPAAIRRMRREGHAVANHTWDHPELTTLSAAGVRSQLKRTTKAAGGAMGACMRPPYGRIDTQTAEQAIDLGLAPVLWTAHIEDWNTHPVAWYTQRLREATKPGAIILMHDTKSATVAAVAVMLPKWRKQGYQLAAIPRCLLQP